MSSTSSGLDATNRHEVLRGPSVGIVPILVQNRVSFSIALVPQLQLWILIVWCTYRTWGACIFKCLKFYTSCLTKTLPYFLFKWALPSRSHSGTPPLTEKSDMCKSQSPSNSTSQIFQLRHSSSVKIFFTVFPFQRVMFIFFPHSTEPHVIRGVIDK